MNDTERTVSHYRVLHPLGAGGMGEVYAGLDETLQRRVALKAIRAEHRLSPVSKARFLREARILSQLDHAGICRVYDFIEGEGTDWLVLELIEGKSLQAALRSGLDPASRLKIAAQIADVLVATHTAGVVHRDLKPGNIMLTRGDEVKVLDFGLAQNEIPASLVAASAAGCPPIDVEAECANSAATVGAPPAARTVGPVPLPARTEGGAVLGTPAYMSPEQARGEPATAASDMYSFGLLLQEICTGRSPYPADLSVSELLERARSADTLRPHGVRADVAALIMRLKHHAPAQRPTAVDTAARLSWIRERPRRVARRLIAAGLILVAALAAAKYTVDLSRERTAAVAAREDANRRRAQAEDLIGFMLGDLRKRLEPVGRLDILNAVGTKAMDYFAVVPESSLSDGELLRRSAALYQIGDVRIALGNLEAAAAPLEESLVLARALVERNPQDGDRLFGLAQSHFWVGFVHWRRHQLDFAEREFRAYLDVAHRLVALNAARPDWQREVAYANSNLGSVLEARGDLERALERYRACLAIEQSLLKATPADRELQHSIAASHNSIGVVLRSIGRFAEALEQFDSEIALREGLLSAEPGNATFGLRLGVASAHIGHVLAAQGRTSEAIRRFERAVAAYRELAARDPSNSDWQRELATGHLVLGNALLAEKGHERALPLLRRAVSITRRLIAGDPTNVGWRRDLSEQQRALAHALLASGDPTGAAREAQAALTLMRDLLNQAAEDRHARRIASGTYAVLARVAATRGDRAAARGHWQRACDVLGSSAGGSSDYRFLDPLAQCLVALGRTAEAAPVLQKLAGMGYRAPTFLKAVDVAGHSLPARGW